MLITLPPPPQIDAARPAPPSPDRCCSDNYIKAVVANPPRPLHLIPCTIGCSCLPSCLPTSFHRCPDTTLGSASPPPPPTGGQTVLEYYNLAGVNKWAYLGYNSLFFVFFFLCTWVIMSFKKYQVR